MSTDIDLPPVYDALAKVANGKIYWADNQRDWMATFVQTLIEYLTSGGIFVPRLTTAQRDALDSPQEGQMIYNTDSIPGPPRTGEFQVWQIKAPATTGAWFTITTT